MHVPKPVGGIAYIDGKPRPFLNFLDNSLCKVLVGMMGFCSGCFNMAITTDFPEFSPKLHLTSIMVDPGRNSHISDEVLKCSWAFFLRFHEYTVHMLCGHANKDLSTSVPIEILDLFSREDCVCSHSFIDPK